MYTTKTKLVAIHTTITKDEQKLCDQNGWEYNDLIRQGIKAKQNQTDQQTQITEILKRLNYMEDFLTKNTTFKY